jgi:2-hydroxychromene-2-carboxylate isomerase
MSIRPRLEFWFEFASTYSYLAAHRIEKLAATKGVDVSWRPFSLGPIFAAQGWTNSPFNIYEMKGRNMWRDMERLCALYGLPLKRPEIFPQNGLTAARVALSLPDGERRAAFVKAVYSANFANGENIKDDDVLDRILTHLGEDIASLRATASTDTIKATFKANTDDAISKGIYGAPSFVTVSGELFWGNDRLEQALDWAVTKR